MTSCRTILARIGTLFALGLLIATAHAALADVFNVSPSGDAVGETDWSNIMQAFDSAKAAGPGSEVQLEVGTFYIRRPIQIANFVGTFRGAGMGTTILTNPPGRGLEATSPPALMIGAPLIFYQDSTWPEGVAQDVAVEHLTIVLTEQSIPVGVFGVPQAFSNVVEFVGRVTQSGNVNETAIVNATFNSVEIDGGNFADYGVQFLNQFDFFEDTIEVEYQGETLTVRNMTITDWTFKSASGAWRFNRCEFSNLLRTGVDMGHGDHPDTDLVVDHGDLPQLERRVRRQLGSH